MKENAIFQLQILDYFVCSLKLYVPQKGFPAGVSVKEPTCQCRRPKRLGFNPWVGKLPGGGRGNPLQYFCLENPLDRRAWLATVHRVSKSQIWLKWLSMQKHMGCCGLKFSVTTAAKSSYRGNRKRSLTPLSRLRYSFMLNTNSSGILLPNVVSFHILNLLKEARLCYMLCSIECEGSGIYITPVLKHLQTGM